MNVYHNIHSHLLINMTLSIWTSVILLFLIIRAMIIRNKEKLNESFPFRLEKDLFMRIVEFISFVLCILSDYCFFYYCTCSWWWIIVLSSSKESDVVFDKKSCRYGLLLNDTMNSRENVWWSFNYSFILWTSRYDSCFYNRLCVGRGHAGIKYYLSSHDNHCVVCGKED